MSQTPTTTDVARVRARPVAVLKPSGPRRRSKGDPSATVVITLFLALLLITGLFAGFLGSISGGLL